uniref:B30.2/SPRY domain-containing protein n=1 Tax=Globodera pallida TaxID=36090 RepID=A0A183CMP7_GLOPA
MFCIFFLYLGHKPSTQSSFVRLLTDQKAKNRFNPKDCHINLHIFKPNFVRVIFLGSEKAHRTVRAEFSLSQKSGISYFEVTIVRLQNMYESLIGVGMATKAMPLDTWIGEHRENYAYYDSGYIYGHSINYICGFPRYETGDVIGCGVNWATHEIIYTKNGERLDTANLYVLTTTDLYPAVTMYNPGDIVEANFGPIFQYNYISDN